jgi:uncharacterized protein YidB (DUF937 family)
MGLLDSVLGSVLGNSAGGGNAMLMQVVGSLLSGAGGAGGAGGGAGGLAGLLQQLQQGGLGEAVQSWVSTGHNLPVSADQLHAALGGDQVSAMAQQAGMSQDDLMGQLAHMLPQVVDHLTPHGELPAGDTGADLAGQLGGLLSGFLKR